MSFYTQGVFQMNRALYLSSSVCSVYMISRDFAYLKSHVCSLVCIICPNSKLEWIAHAHPAKTHMREETLDSSSSDPDQTAQMRTLIWFFRRTYLKVFSHVVA